MANNTARKKKYSSSFDELEKKLARVMTRLNVENYQSDWTQSKLGNSCVVEMLYNGRAYRFENSTDKSAACGRNLTYASDLFAAVVYSLEGLARAVEQGIFTLDMLLEGVPALPAASPLAPCFQALGFSEKPQSTDEVKENYRRLAKVMHPDAGGDEAAFRTLKGNYNACLREMEDGV